MQKKISLKDAVRFHGHLGPYLVLGLLAGELALKKLKTKKYFNLEVNVRGADKKPKSCLIDGLQLSTGATYGKGNIHKYKAKAIKITIRNRTNNQQAAVLLDKQLIKELESLKGHADSEKFARKLFNTEHQKIFTLNIS